MDRTKIPRALADFAEAFMESMGLTLTDFRGYNFVPEELTPARFDEIQLYGPIEGVTIVFGNVQNTEANMGVHYVIYASSFLKEHRRHVPIM